MIWAKKDQRVTTNKQTLTWLALFCLPSEKREGAQQGKIPNRISTLRYLLALVMIGFISSIAHAMDAETLRKETGWSDAL